MNDKVRIGALEENEMRYVKNLMFGIALLIPLNFQCLGCELIDKMSTLRERIPAMQYEWMGKFVRLTINSYFPQKEKKIEAKGDYIYLSEENEIIKLRNGIVIEFMCPEKYGELLAEIDILNLAINFRSSLNFRASFFVNNYKVPQKEEAEKISIFASDKISWKEGTHISGRI